MSDMFSFKKFNREGSASRFNESTSGSKSLEPGEHTVKITSVTPYQQYGSIRFSFEDKDSKYVSSFVSVYGASQNAEGKWEETDEMSYRLLSLLRAITGTEIKALDLAESLSESPHLMNALTGMTILANVKAGERGYNVVKNPDASLSIVDAGAGKYTEIIEQFLPNNSFQSYTEVKAAIEGLIMQGIKLPRAFNEVANFNRPTQEEVDANNAAIQTAKQAGSSSMSASSPFVLPDLTGTSD